MISYQIPEQNPIRGRLISDGTFNIEIDYINRLPQFGLMKPNIQYQAGIYTTEKEFYPDFKINEIIYLQIQAETDPIAYITTTDGTVNTTMTRSNITPASWTGLNIYQFSFNLTQIGFYDISMRFEATDPYDPEDVTDFVLSFDTFRVKSSLPTDKDLIELQFYSNQNSEDFIFNRYYTAYYTGQFKKTPPQWNVSMFEEDEKNKLASRSFSKQQVILTEIKDTYYDTICKQLESDIILCNGIPFTCEEPPEFEEIPQTDLLNITFELTGKYNNNVVIIS
jgi:hypothetical protein